MVAPTPSKRVNIEEDVDDLDDLIGQFSPQVPKTPKNSVNQTQAPTPPQNAAASPKPQTTAGLSSDSKSPAAPDAFSDDFAKEFAKGMESLLKEIGGEGALPTEGGISEDDLEKDKVFKAAWESLFMEGIGGAENVSDSQPPSTSTTATQPGAPDDSFQSRIKRSMEKMKESESTLKADAGSSNSEMESLLAELGKMGEGGEGDEDLQGILESMMSQLMSKEVLYEPLKELHDKFPAYLTENAAKLSTEDKKRYESQQDCVRKIIAIFESPKYSEEDPEQGIKVVTLMNEMQSFGAPPAEIMGELPPGMSMGSDGLPQMPDGCTVM